jgi:hypothetical protein
MNIFFVTIFTVYRTSTAVELRSGYDDYAGGKVVCSCRSYEQAKHIAQLDATLHCLPLNDYAELSEAQN